MEVSCHPEFIWSVVRKKVCDAVEERSLMIALAWIIDSLREGP